MTPYLNLLHYVAEHGELVPTRAKVGGEYVDAYSVFGASLRVDLNDGFPLLTTKRVHFDSVFHELIWFFGGNVLIDYMQMHGVTIWDEWADETGWVGRMYGAQWRDFGSRIGDYGYESGEDQIKRLVAQIHDVRDNPRSPEARRMIVTAWHPKEAFESALPPCHVLFQMHVSGPIGARRLTCQVYQRSADLFLGVPFNVASYALLTHLLAARAGIGVGELIFTFGDLHIYANHVTQVREQLSREPRPLPTIGIDPAVVGLDDLSEVKREHVAIVGYDPHRGIKGEVAV